MQKKLLFNDIKSNKETVKSKTCYALRTKHHVFQIIGILKQYQ